MPLAPGSSLGPYKILAAIGAGGMGEVYRARDTRLDRDVAIKVLPAALAGNPERLSRFEREAKLLAALNHPNIAHIYGLEEAPGGRALVMELVPGTTLEGPLVLQTALHCARQIAEALEAAHEKGIVHRDLKPGNIMITPEGVVKVLDFGLAAAAQPAAEGGDPNQSPTLTAATQTGVIMGTAAYMSPEQAAGKPVDKRSDIWSFGVVLWEMLTGRRLFEGETISHTLAHVLTAPIEWSRLPSNTLPPILNLLRRCLDRDVKTRLRDIGEARITLSEPVLPVSIERSRPRLGWLAAVAALFLASTVVFAFLWLRAPTPDQPAVQFEIGPPNGTEFTSPYSATAVSPDGRFIVFAAGARGKIQRLPSHAIAGDVLPSENAPLWLRPVELVRCPPLGRNRGR